MAHFIELTKQNFGSIQVNIDHIAYFHEGKSSTEIYLWASDVSNKPLLIMAEETYPEIKKLIYKAWQKVSVRS